MALTDRTFSRVSNYGRILKSTPIVGNFARFMVNIFVGILSAVGGWSFPEKFPWDWRLEMILGRYEKETTDLFKEIVKPGMTVVDIGAHIGYFTRLFSKLVGRNGIVIAFDADKSNFNLLRENIKKIRYNNVTLVNKAISDKNGVIEFYNVNNKTGCHSIITPMAASEKVIVPTATLDAFLEASGINNVDVIKIDIEGGEHIAFLGMRRLFGQKNTLSILSEYCPKHLKNAGVDPVGFLKEMTEYGFLIYQVLPGGKLEPLNFANVANLPFYEMGYTNLLFKKN